MPWLHLPRGVPVADFALAQLALGLSLVNSGRKRLDTCGHRLGVERRAPRRLQIRQERSSIRHCAREPRWRAKGQCKLPDRRSFPCSQSLGLPRLAYAFAESRVSTHALGAGVQPGSRVTTDRRQPMRGTNPTSPAFKLCSAANSRLRRTMCSTN